MLLEQFQQLAEEGYNRIPLMHQVLADLETPVSSYLKLAEGPYSYLFESVQGGEKWGRFSFIGLPCRKVLKVYDHEIVIELDGKEQQRFTVTDPLAYIEEFKNQYKVPELDDVPLFHGGLVGYFSYDTVRLVEKRLATSVPEDELGVPDILLMVSDEVLAFDNLAGTLSLVKLVDPAEKNAFEKGFQRLHELAAILPTKNITLADIDVNIDQGKTLAEKNFISQMGEQNFKEAVEKIRDYTLAGDTMQVVPSQRLKAPFQAQPINLYRALRRLNPSPYMYFLDLSDFHIVGSSPEILARVEEGLVTVRPIAGTRRRGYNEAEDVALENELLADPKEIAEHLMLIDLGRNDAGRVSKIGSVCLTDKMMVERYSHVMHIVSNVTGTLRDGLSAMDVLKATLPAGTLSGAPKIRAMEIIDEVETVKRGVYGGAIGYLSWNGNMDTAIAIRTAVIKDKVLYVQAGAGVVADSVPELEWKETMNKARAVMRAAAMADPTLNTVSDEGEA